MGNVTSLDLEAKTFVITTNGEDFCFKYDDVSKETYEYISNLEENFTAELGDSSVEYTPLHHTGLLQLRKKESGLVLEVGPDYNDPVREFCRGLVNVIHDDLLVD